MRAGFTSVEVFRIRGPIEKAQSSQTLIVFASKWASSATRCTNPHNPDSRSFRTGRNATSCCPHAISTGFCLKGEQKPSLSNRSICPCVKSSKWNALTPVTSSRSPLLRGTRRRASCLELTTNRLQNSGFPKSGERSSVRPQKLVVSFGGSLDCSSGF